MDGEKIFGEIMTHVDELVSALGKGAVHVYGVFVKQAIAWGVGDLLMVIVAALILIISTKELRNGYRGWVERGRKAEEDGGYLFWIIPIVAFSIVGTTCLIQGTMHLINPEYYAIQAVLETFKK